MMLEMILACYFTFPPFCVVKTVFNKVRVLRLLELIVYQILQSIQSIQLLCPGANQPITNISHPSLCFLFIFCLSLNSFSNKRKCQKKACLPITPSRNIQQDREQTSFQTFIQMFFKLLFHSLLVRII